MKEERPESRTREEIAREEVGQTDISPGVKWFLVIIFLLAIFSVPVSQRMAAGSTVSPAGFSGSPVTALYQAVLDRAATRSSSGGVFHRIQRTNAEMLRGIHAIEDYLDEHSVLTEWVAPPTEHVLVGLLRAGSEEAYCGRDRSLFYRPGIDYLTGRGFLEPEVMEARSRAGSEWENPPQPDPVKALIELHDQLAGRGIDLIVLPAPTKAMVYPEWFAGHCEDVTAPYQNPSYDEFQRRMEEAGIRVFDAARVLLEAKQEARYPLYLETDTHWSPVGMEIVADALARYLDESDLLPAHEPIQYARTMDTIENLGDIANMLALPEGQTYYPRQQVEIHPVSRPDGSEWQSDSKADVLLLGDSFANVYSLEGMGWGHRAGFAEQLSYALQRPIDAIAVNANGSYASRRALSQDIRRGNDRLEGKSLVIYEFAIRELAVGDWRLGLDLHPPETAAPRTVAATVPEGLTVRGVATAVARVPKPGSVPYKDCVVAIHLTEVQPVQGSLSAAEILVFTWGMRDNKLQEAARFKPGDVLTLSLVPWAEVEATYGGYNRVELEDDDLLWLDAFWAKTDDDPPGDAQESVEDSASGGAAPPTEPAASSEVPAATAAILDEWARDVATCEQQEKAVVQGKDGWLFFVPELRSLTVGPFWGESTATVSRASNSEWADPLPAILDFNQQLSSAGVTLLFMPVPAKAAVYPEMAATNPTDASVRYDLYARRFYDLLEAQGISVIDLVPAFRTARAEEGDPPLYCRQDTHWSGRACELAAALIADRLRGQPWMEEVPKRAYGREKTQIEIEGDLYGYLNDPTLAKETLTLQQVLETTAEGPQPVQPWRESPVLLLGDSHCLVFQAGQDMHAQGAGLADHLAAELGFPVDLVGVRGSGATPARITLLRRRDNLAGKRVVIWCFTARDFTEAFDGWRPLPVIRKAP